MESSRDLPGDTLPGSGVSRVPRGAGKGRVPALLEKTPLGVFRSGQPRPQAPLRGLGLRGRPPDTVLMGAACVTSQKGSFLHPREPGSHAPRSLLSQKWGHWECGPALGACILELPLFPSLFADEAQNENPTWQSCMHPSGLPCCSAPGSVFKSHHLCKHEVPAAWDLRRSPFHQARPRLLSPSPFPNVVPVLTFLLPKCSHLLGFQQAPLRYPRLGALETQRVPRSTQNIPSEQASPSHRVRKNGATNSQVHLLLAGMMGLRCVPPPCDRSEMTRPETVLLFSNIGASNMLVCWDLAAHRTHSWISRLPVLCFCPHM